MPKKTIVPINVAIKNPEDNTVILGYIEVETLKEAQKYLEKKYPDHEIVSMDKGLRQKL